MAVHLRALSSGDVVTADEYIANEVPAGNINSINTIYTLANTPSPGTVSVHLNGVLQTPGASYDYTLSGTTITFNKAPHTGSEILVNYVKQS